MVARKTLFVAVFGCVASLFGSLVWCDIDAVAETASDTEGSSESISFNSDIRPILSEYCFACHGPDEQHRSADLRLDLREPAIEYGALVAGEPDESLIIERILSDDPDLIMPPPESNKRVSAAEKKLLSAWIEQGATYESHWSFQPLPQTIPVPTFNQTSETRRWIRTSVDAFIARAHQENGFRPTEPAEKATWLRRVTYDLTGLPPSIEELTAFESDDSDDAYDKVVERLLKSPAYGERMAVMWLDVARYADTFGYQNDIVMEVWPWREWVIDAFNRNMPYDQFLTEQIAGDLIPDATVHQRLATTFNRLHRQTNEGGSVAEEFRLTGITDRTTTAGTTFLGLTMECCRCHDHKFDPIKQKEFYALSAYFSDIDEFGLYSHFTFSAPTPAILLYEGDQQEKHLALKQEIAKSEAALTKATRVTRDQMRSQAKALSTEIPQPREPIFTHELDGEVEGVSATATRCNGDDAIQCEGAPVFGRAATFTYSIWVRPKSHSPRMLVLSQSRAAEDAAFRGLELTIDDGHPQFSMIHFWPGNAVRVRATDAIPTGEWTHLAVTHDGSGKASGIQLFIDGRVANVDVVRDKLTRDVRQRNDWGDLDVDKTALALGARFRDIGFREGAVDDLNVYDVQLSSAEVLGLVKSTNAGAGPDHLNSEQAIEHQLLTKDANLASLRSTLKKVRERENEMVAGVREIMTMQHYDDAPPTHVLGRGEYTNKEAAVSPATPTLAGGIPGAGEDRLSLAKWMVDSQNPLTSRVIANRMWHLFFGRGIVVSLEDFGSQGTPPTHPDLLNHLAKSLMENDWNLHWLCREIVLSSAYRQSSKVADATLYEKDRDNAWLTRGPNHRLSAEQLRDTVLAASGLLVEKIGGPSVMPYQPAGLWKESGTGKQYTQSTGEGLYRRSLYTFWKRTAPPPTMLTLDATSRESCTPRRELTTTPLQALVFLNDPQYVEASRTLAESLIQNHKSDTEARWNELCRRLISRIPSEPERAVLESLYQEQRAFFESSTSDTAEFLDVGNRPVNDALDQTDLAATTIVVQAMFAYDETIMLR